MRVLHVIYNLHTGHSYNARNSKEPKLQQSLQPGFLGLENMMGLLPLSHVLCVLCVSFSMCRILWVSSPHMCCVCCMCPLPCAENTMGLLPLSCAVCVVCVTVSCLENDFFERSHLPSQWPCSAVRSSQLWFECSAELINTCGFSTLWKCTAYSLQG